MSSEASTLREKVFREIKKLEIMGLVSVSLVGSFQYSKKLHDVNDIDLIVLVEKLTSAASFLNLDSTVS